MLALAGGTVKCSRRTTFVVVVGLLLVAMVFGTSAAAKTKPKHKPKSTPTTTTLAILHP
jgi:hypothetical protein